MARVDVEIAPNEVIRLMGPMRVHVKRGRVMILGAVFTEGESFEISRYRSYGVKAVDDAAVISIVMGEGGSIEQPGVEEEVIDEWVKVGDEIVTSLSSGDSVVVLGPTDAGKSSLVALLANRAIHAGRRVAVIDGDIGQADVGPPGFVSAAFVKERILWLRALRAEQLRFIGSITPARFEKRILAGLLDLYNWARSEGAELVLFDTDGWIYGLNALEYKLELIRVIRPRAVIVVGDEVVASIVLKALKGVQTRVYYLSSPSVVRVRDREDRRVLRGEAYARFFEGAVTREINLRDVAVFGSCLFMGELLDPQTLDSYSKELGVNILAGSEGPDFIMLVGDRQPRTGALERLMREKQVYYTVAGSERGLYAAVLDQGLVERAPAILLELDYKELKAKIYTAYTGEIGGIIFGSIKLSIEGGIEEVGRVQRCSI